MSFYVLYIGVCASMLKGIILHRKMLGSSKSLPAFFYIPTHHIGNGVKRQS